MKLRSQSAFWLLLLAMLAPRASAGPIVWNLVPTLLQGCCVPPLNQQQGLISGTFAFDPQSQSYSGWEFNISGFTDPVSPLNGTLTPASSSIIVGGPTFLHLKYASQQANLVLAFGYLTTFGVVEVPLSTFGGNVPVLISDSPDFASFFAQGRSSVSSVPEPVAGVLVLIGAVFLTVSSKRRAVFGRSTKS